HALGEPHVASHYGARADPHRAQDGRARVDDDAALDVGMAFPPLDDPALGITGEVERAERHALVDGHLVPDLARLTDHDPGPVVDEEAPPDARPGMDVDAGTRVGVLAHDARDDRHALGMEDVRQSIHRSRLETRVGEDDLLERLRGRIPVVGRFDVGPEDGTNVRDLGEQLQGCRLGPGAAVLELAVVGRGGHGVTTLDRLLPDVGLDETEILVHPPRDLRADIRGALVAGLVGLIGGVTGTLTIGGRRGRERGDAKGTVGYLTSIGDSFPASDPPPWTPGTIWRDTGARPGVRRGSGAVDGACSAMNPYRRGWTG